MLRSTRFRNVTSESSIIVHYGRPVCNMFIPFRRVNEIMSRGRRPQTLEISAVISVFGEIVRSMQVGQGALGVNRVVCIQIRNVNGYVNDDRLECECLANPDASLSVHLYTLTISNEDGIPTAHGIQTAAMLVERYMRDENADRTVFAVGCLKGLNRTGFVICAVLHTLMGVSPIASLAAFRHAHYPGVVKQAFIDTLLQRYGARTESVLDAMPANFSYYNIVNRELLPKGITADEEKMVSFGEGVFSPMVDIHCGENCSRLTDRAGQVVSLNGGYGLRQSASSDVRFLMNSALRACGIDPIATGRRRVPTINPSFLDVGGPAPPGARWPAPPARPRDRGHLH
jgi:hypothetical protein